MLRRYSFYRKALLSGLLLALLGLWLGGSFAPRTSQATTFATSSLPSLRINDWSGMVEGDPSDTKFVTFQITLSAASSETVTVDYATADDTAVAPWGLYRYQWDRYFRTWGNYPKYPGIFNC